MAANSTSWKEFNSRQPIFHFFSSSGETIQTDPLYWISIPKDCLERSRERGPQRREKAIFLVGRMETQSHNIIWVSRINYSSSELKCSLDNSGDWVLLWLKFPEEQLGMLRTIPLLYKLGELEWPMANRGPNLMTLNYRIKVVAGDQF